MLGESGILECRYRECRPEEVMIEGKCRHVDDTTMCNGSGTKVILLKISIFREGVKKSSSCCQAQFQ